jgi:hypothetical protein
MGRPSVLTCCPLGETLLWIEGGVASGPQSGFLQKSLTLGFIVIALGIP